MLTEPAMLCDGAWCAPVIMDMEPATGDRGFAQILRAAGDLRQDIAMTTGAVDYAVVRDLMVDDADARDIRLREAADRCPGLVPALVARHADGWAVTDGPARLLAGAGDGADAGAEAARLPMAVVIGTTRGDSPVVEALQEQGRLPEAGRVVGRWEAFALTMVEGPLPQLPGVQRALVIVGSDPRGAIYGIYALSRMIGVSPWYWISDVPVRRRLPLICPVESGSPVVNEGPSVRFRGIFFNDEDVSMSRWARDKFPTGQGTPDVNFYRHWFEAVLRLGLNTLNPAMHPVSTAFCQAVDADGVPVNAREAARYGVVIGTSHCENMLRTNTGEWEPWFESHRDRFDMQATADAVVESRERAISLESDLAYDFTVNREAVLEYWRERLETNRDFESILTLGIRGIHDGAFHCARLDRYPGASDAERKVAFMKDVIDAQRALIDDVYAPVLGPDARLKVPQVLIVYKEVADVYNAGLADILAGGEYADITLVWAEDNYGFLRQRPNDVEAARPGGAGVYYHSSYLGSPHSYLWLNSVPLGLMADQLRRAWDTGMGSVWILNIGDGKPGDLATEFFAALAWDPCAGSEAGVETFLAGQGRRDYRLDEAQSRDYARAVVEYFRLVAIKRPEFLTTVYHAHDLSVDGDEAERWRERSRRVVRELERISRDLDEDTAIAMFEQIRYHALSLNDVAEEYTAYWRALQAQRQGRWGVLPALRAAVASAVDNIWRRLDEYGSLHGGKWHGYLNWGEDADAPFPLDEVVWGHDFVRDREVPVVGVLEPGVGAACGGERLAGRGVLRFDCNTPELRRFVEVFSRGDKSAAWTMQVTGEGASCVRLSQGSGVVETVQRVEVSVDWTAVERLYPEGGRHVARVVVFDGDAGERRIDQAKAVFVVIMECDGASQVSTDAGEGTDSGRRYAESCGMVVIDATEPSRLVPGNDGSAWQLVPDFGQHGRAMEVRPHVGRSELGQGARLEYDVWFREAGVYPGYVCRVPTLDEGCEADGTARSCALALRVNDAPRQRLEGNRNWLAQQGNSFVYPDLDNPWADNLLRGHERMAFAIEARQGWNRLSIERLDPSVAIERIVVQTQPGAACDTLMVP